MDRRYDVVVVGAGPAGSAAADVCAGSGLSTLLLEEQAHIGYPVQCAGLLSVSAYRECRVSSRSVLNTVSGATIRAGNSGISFDAGVTKAYVVDRGELDREMAAKAGDKGAEILVKSIGCSPTLKKHRIQVRSGGELTDVSYQVLIAADGPRSSISRRAGLPRAPVYLSGLQCDILYPMDQDKVIIYPNASPEFFGYLIPIGEGRARVGMCGISNMKTRFEQFIRQFGKNTIQYVSGTVPLGTIGKTYSEGLLVAGDAAALAKPTSGGGVYTGIRSARHAAEIAIKACEEGRTDERYLSAYQQRWKRDFGRELAIGMAAFRIRQMISPGEIETMLERMSDPEIVKTIVAKGDMDRPGRLVGSLMMNPRMLGVSGRIIHSLVRNWRDG